MKVLLLFLLAVILLAARSARLGRPLRVWPLLVVSFFVGATFLSQRVI